MADLEFGWDALVLVPRGMVKPASGDNAKHHALGGATQERIFVGLFAQGLTARLTPRRMAGSAASSMLIASLQPPLGRQAVIDSFPAGRLRKT